MGDKSDLHKVIPILFDITDASFKSHQNKTQDTFMVQTRSQAKCVKAPTTRELTCSMWKKVKDIKPIIIEDDDDQDISNLNKDNLTNKEVSSCITPPIAPDQVYSQPNTRPPPRPPDPSEFNPKVTEQIETNLDFEENSPHQEGIITKTYESPDNSYLEQPQELSDLVDSTKLYISICQN